MPGSKVLLPQHHNILKGSAACLLQGDNMKKKNYELLRILSCIAVVFHHVTNQPAFLYGNGDTSFLYVNNVTFFAVPVFLTITGFIQLRPEHEFALWRAEKKVLVPLVSFGLLYAGMEVFFNTRSISGKSLIQAVLAFLQGHGWTHMWYLYMIVGLYLFFPLLRAYIAKGKRELVFLLAVLFAFNIILKTVEEFAGFSFGVTIPVAAPYLFYCLLGYYIYRYPLSLRLSSFLSAASLGIMLVWTMFTMKGFHYYSFPVALFSFSLFSLFTALEEQCSHLNGKVLYFLSDKTFGIYIVHMLIINIVYKIIRFNPYRFILPISWLGVGAAAFAISILAVLLIRRIPVINKVFCV